MKKEIARLNAMLGKRCMEGKKPAGGKVEKPKRPHTKVEEIHASKMGLGTLMEVKPMGER